MCVCVCMCVCSTICAASSQNLDALSANNDTYVYEVPSAKELPGLGGEMDFDSNNFESQFTLNFSLLRTLVSIVTCNKHELYGFMYK